MELRLALYRARPIRPVGLVGAAFGTGSLTLWAVRWAMSQRPVADGLVALSLFAAGIAFGAFTALVSAADVDRAEPLLKAMPRSYMSTFAARSVVWVAGSFTILVVIAGVGARSLDVSHGRATMVAAIPFLLSAAVAVTMGRLSGALIGAGIGMAASGVYLATSLLLPTWGLAIPLDPSRPGFASGIGNALVASGLILVVATASVPTLVRRTEESF